MPRITRTQVQQGGWGAHQAGHHAPRGMVSCGAYCTPAQMLTIEADLHSHCSVFVESLTKAIESKFIAKSDAEDRPKLRLVTDAAAAEDSGP